MGSIIGATVGGIVGAYLGAALGSAIGYGVGMVWGTAPVAGSNGAIVLWSGGKGTAARAAAQFAGQTGANMVSNTFAGKTLEFASHFLPRALSDFLWGQLSVEFISGASSATVFLSVANMRPDSVYQIYEIGALLRMGVEYITHYL